MMKSKEKGFSLIEVLVTLVVLSVGLVYIIGSLRTSIYSVKVSKDYYASYLLLENKMWELNAEGSFSIGTEEYSCDEEDPIDCSYKAEITEPNGEILSHLVLKLIDKQEKEISSLETLVILNEDL
ncbi:MAG: prepilin-type N-terminal cleavage/methylation domain-containing protein [bacterium]